MRDDVPGGTGPSAGNPCRRRSSRPASESCATAPSLSCRTAPASTPDVRGGFSLPNGDYVTRAPDGALVLPTGARCVPQQGGYLCP